MFRHNIRLILIVLENEINLIIFSLLNIKSLLILLSRKVIQSNPLDPLTKLFLKKILLILVIGKNKVKIVMPVQLLSSLNS